MRFIVDRCANFVGPNPIIFVGSPCGWNSGITHTRWLEVSSHGGAIRIPGVEEPRHGLHTSVLGFLTCMFWLLSCGIHYDTYSLYENNTVFLLTLPNSCVYSHLPVHIFFQSMFRHTTFLVLCEHVDFISDNIPRKLAPSLTFPKLVTIQPCGMWWTTAKRPSYGIPAGWRVTTTVEFHGQDTNTFLLPILFHPTILYVSTLSSKL